MAFIIAFAGKGGTGKTTIASLTIRYLIEKKNKPVLAVDADPNSCLHEALGVDVHASIGTIREDSLTLIRSGSERPGGMSMAQMFDYQIQRSIVESKGFDLIVMGRPEGPGCYCAANTIIRKYTDKLSTAYPYVVIDNEAGLEHLSRRTTHRADVILIISDPTVKGIHAAMRINKLIDELGLEVGRRVVLINRADDHMASELRERSKKEGLDIAGSIPNDPGIARSDLHGKDLLHLPPDSEAILSLFKILDSLKIP